VQAIRAVDADIVALQEVRPRALHYLRRAFPGTPLLGHGRDAGGGGEHVPVLVADRSWCVEASETRWLSPTPRHAGSRGWDAGMPRIATIVRLRREGVAIGVVNTHFDHRGGEARRHSAEMVVEWTSAEPERRWIVLGDLNAPPGSPPLRALAAGGFRDALAGVAGGTEHAFTGATDRTRIDHVLVGAGWTVVGGEIRHDRPFGRLPSDHWPVVADLRIDEQGPG
jgi:endonuclease/exonuclease/phosphatase family metal-dependent hydrolase